MNKLLYTGIALLSILLLSGVNNYASAEQNLRRLGRGELNRYLNTNHKIDYRLSETLTAIKHKAVSESNLSALNIEDLSTPLVKVNNNGNIEVDLYCSDVSDENLNKLLALGFETEVINEELKVVEGWLPYDKLEQASELGFVIRVKAPSYGHTRKGAVTTEGDSLLNADDARETFGVDGSGIKVGVISDGVASLAASQFSGDLPKFVQIGDPGSGDEGTALLEIVHDIAPGAELAFTSGTSVLKFLNAIEFLCDIGVDVIVDDVGFLSEPFFEDGLVAQAAAEAVSKGKVFVSAAGNDADRHYQALYVDTDPGNDDNNNHDFGIAAGENSETGLTVEIPPNGIAIVVLQWNDPFNAPTNDYDLYLVDSLTQELLDSSISVQDGSGEPIEIAGVQNLSPSNSGFLEVVIDKFSGEPKVLEIYYNGRVFPTEFNVSSDSIYGHPAVEGVLAVGALEGLSVVDFFSSEGPVSIFFDPPTTTLSSGNNLVSAQGDHLVRLNNNVPVEKRNKPDLAASNRISTTVPGFETFAGTSASAPHVAGIAALVLQALESGAVNSARDESLSTVSIRNHEQTANILTSTAVDLAPLGFDFFSGFGRVDAFNAVELAIELGGGVIVEPPVVDPGDGSGDGDGGGGGGCSISETVSVEQSASSLMNLLILLVPAFVIGLRSVRKRLY